MSSLTRTARLPSGEASEGVHRVVARAHRIGKLALGAQLGQFRPCALDEVSGCGGSGFCLRVGVIDERLGAGCRKGTARTRELRDRHDGARLGLPLGGMVLDRRPWVTRIDVDDGGRSPVVDHRVSLLEGRLRFLGFGWLPRFSDRPSSQRVGWWRDTRSVRTKWKRSPRNCASLAFTRGASSEPARSARLSFNPAPRVLGDELPLESRKIKLASLAKIVGVDLGDKSFVAPEALGNGNG